MADAAASPASGESFPSGYFEAMYARETDPWGFATSAYEREKYAATIAALPRSRYHAAFEIGCSVGVLTEMLAPRCDALLATDCAASVLDTARARCAEYPQVQFAAMQVPEDWPEGMLDLIVLSEVGYYLSLSDLGTLRARIAAHLVPGGHLLLVHWTPRINECVLTGDDVHALFHEWEGTRFSHRVGERAATYRLDLWERLPDVTR